MIHNKLLIEQKAEEDIEPSLQWYSQKNLELAQAFLNEIEVSFKTIQNHPTRWPILKRGVRRLVTKHFPFSIFYLIKNQSILIIAVHHHRRNEQRWIKRALNS